MAHSNLISGQKDVVTIATQPALEEWKKGRKVTLLGNKVMLKRALLTSTKSFSSWHHPECIALPTSPAIWIWEVHFIVIVSGEKYDFLRSPSCLLTYFLQSKWPSWTGYLMGGWIHPLQYEWVDWCHVILKFIRSLPDPLGWIVGIKRTEILTIPGALYSIAPAGDQIGWR